MSRIPLAIAGWLAASCAGPAAVQAPPPSMPAAVRTSPPAAPEPPVCNDDTPTATTASCTTACAAGSAAACAATAERYRSGDRVRRDGSKALAYAERACDLDSAAGCVAVATLYSESKRYGDYVYSEEIEQHQRRAVPLEERACGGGDADACDALSTQLGPWREHLHWLTSDADRADALAARARSLREAACDAGRGRACAMLAKPDPELDDRACELGYAPACTGVSLRRGCELGWPLACATLVRSGTLDGAERRALLQRGCELDDGGSCATASIELDATGDHTAAVRARVHACTLGDAQQCALLHGEPLQP